jgi:hypothetical protein
MTTPRRRPTAGEIASLQGAAMARVVLEERQRIATALRRTRLICWLSLALATLSLLLR